MWQFLSQIYKVDEIMTGHSMMVQVRTMISTVIYNNKFRIGGMTLRIILTVPYEMFWNIHLKIDRAIFLIVSSGVKLIDVGVHFDCWGNLYATFPGLLISMPV